MQTYQQSQNGFTLMEILVVMAIIAIIATMSVPIFSNKIIAAQMKESFVMLEEIKPSIKMHYRSYGLFPASNMTIGLPDPEYLIGNYVKKIEVEQGAVHITFGNKAHSSLNGKILSIRPITVIDSPSSPMSWNCGYAKPPKGMVAHGEDKTDIEVRNLPFVCR